jgi:SAM-dependent methyltransferase
MRALPFGAAEILAAVAGAGRVLDAGCGSGRLTVALATAGAAVTGIDTNAGQLAEAERRSDEAGVELTLLEADLDAPLPFADASFDAVTSRLALMAASDPVATLRELRRVLEPGGRIVTVLWGSPDENPWFAEPRAAIGTVLGADRAAFARAFGKLGDLEEAAGVHRAAELVEVEADFVRGVREASDAEAYWRELSAENGHFRRVSESLDETKTGALTEELSRRLAPFRTVDHLALPRTQVLVRARR